MDIKRFCEQIFCQRLENQNSVMSKSLLEARENVEKLASENARLNVILSGQNIPCPKWLDTSQQPYKGVISIAEQDVILDDIKAIYAINPEDRKAFETMFRGPDDFNTLMNIWRFVCDYLQYSYDKAEDWQYPSTTIARKLSDCEDGTILLVTIANALGITDCWNACGWFTNGNEKFGHSFPIANWGDGYYVFETTIHPYNYQRPILFKNSSYDASWGVSNMFFSGKLKDGEIQI